MGAVAGVSYISPSETGGAVSTEQADWPADSNNTVVVQEASGINAPGGLSFREMYAGQATDSGSALATEGVLYVNQLSGKGPFTVSSGGAVSLNALLSVLNNNELAFIGADNGAYDFTVGNMDVAQSGAVNVAAGSSLTVKNADDFAVYGTVTNSGNVEVVANSVVAGKLEAADGDMGLSAANGVFVAGVGTGADASVTISASGESQQNISGTDIEGGIISYGTVQNNGTGSVNLNSASGIYVLDGDADDDTGNLENNNVDGTLTVAGADGTGAAGALIVDGTINNVGNMILSTDSLLVKGGDSATGSIQNTGDLIVNVTNEANVGYGVNLSGMSDDKKFDFTAGSLAFGQDASADMIQGMFLNNLNSYNLSVGGVLDLSQSDVDIVNNSGNMSVGAGNVSVNNVSNAGQELKVVAFGEAGGNVEVEGQVVGSAGAVTNVTAENELSVADAVSNQGTMTLSGTTVKLTSVSNSGADSDLTVSSSTEGGAVLVSGEVTNADGNMLVQAEDITFGAMVTNNSGTMTVKGSDSDNGAVAFESIDIAGGTVNIDALGGAVSFGGNVPSPAAEGAQADSQVAINVSGGVLNFGTNVRDVQSAENVNIDGGLYARENLMTEAGSVNVQSTMAGGASAFTLDAGTNDVVLGKVAADGSISGGDIIIDDATVKRGVTIAADGLHAMGDVTVANSGSMLSLTANSLDIDGLLTVGEGNSLNLTAAQVYTGSVESHGKIMAATSLITADKGNVLFDGNLYMGVTDSYAAAGLFANGNTLTITTTGTDGYDISFGGAQIANGNTLTVSASGDVSFGTEMNNAGVVTMNADNASFAAITNSGTTTVIVTEDITATDTIDNDKNLIMTAADFNLANVDNSDTLNINSLAGTVTMADVDNTSSMVVAGAKAIVAGDIENNAGVMNLNATESINGQSLAVSGTGAKATLNAATAEFANAVSVAGDMVQGATSGALNNLAATFKAGTLDITNGGDLKFVAGGAEYNIAQNVNVAGDIIMSGDALTVVNAGGVLTAAGLENNNVLTIDATGGMSLGSVVNNFGTLTLDSNDNWTALSDLTVNAGAVALYGAGIRGAEAIDTDFALTQGTSGVLANGVNVRAGDFVIETNNLVVGEVNQKSGSMTVKTTNVDVGGSIMAQDLTFAVPNQTNWMSVNVGGDVSGGVGFLGVGTMGVGGNYIFDSGSQLSAVVLPYAEGDGTGVNNYWSTISLNEDDTLGQITNAEGGSALINVEGTFKGGSDYTGASVVNGAALGESQIGITLKDAVNQGTAIWLLHANGGVENFSDLELLRNLDVRYCNADGSICYDYLTSLDDKNSSDEDLPAYVSVRDNDLDGTTDSLYVVFDPRFGGPVLVENMKLQPIVARQPDSTDGEYVSAGALDALIAGQLQDKKFYNKTPIEVIPLAFEGSVMSNAANELYNRMEYYVETADGAPLANFSHLFQVYEAEQVAGVMSLNEHTAFRSFEDRMMDEFIWHRNRNLRKAWLDVDYGMSYQNISTGTHADGHRFSVSGGFDWQDSDTVILGLTGRVSRTSSKASDSVDLSYSTNVLAGHSSVEVTDTNVGLGGYMMKTLGDKTRLYGNAFLDLHMFDINREQNFVTPIDGSGSAFSLISEWGLMHDILNQYVVGNIYARAGYNFGFDITEEVTGGDYMQLESDGYFVLTPGYTLMAQKRIYPSAWFQIRPYMALGVEYDVIGGPDKARYKFDAAKHYTNYDVDIDPLWANIGGGVEFLSANGFQLGVDYRYQYNSDIQLHNIKVSGSYRF